MKFTSSQSKLNCDFCFTIDVGPLCTFDNSCMSLTVTRASFPLWGMVSCAPSLSECFACIKDEEIIIQGGDWPKITTW